MTLLPFYLTKDTTRLAAQEFQGVCVLLLRHHARASAVRVAESDEAKFGGRVYNEILCNATHVGHGQTGPHEELDNKVAVADTIERVLCEGVKAQLLQQEFTVDIEGVSAEGTAAKWKSRNARSKVFQAIEVSTKRECMGEEEV